MLNKIFLLLLFALLSTCGLRAQVPIDTIETNDGTIIVFDNLTWSYMDALEDFFFDGIMNPHLENLLTQEDEVNLIQSWNNDVCYTSERQNNLRALKDTLWLCVLDEVHGDFEMPFDGMVTSRYGYRKGRYHNGIDIDLETGDTVKSCWSGKVRYAKFNKGGFGNLVIVRHHNGLETFYAHLSEISVQPNQEVKAGEVLGLGGNTGHSRGSHLHFEVRFYDAPINPEEIIDFQEKACKKENLLLHAELFRPGAQPSDIMAQRYNAPEKSSPGKSRKYYKIRPGDTLSEVATRNGTSVSTLCQLNGLRPGSNLQIGRTLRIR